MLIFSSAERMFTNIHYILGNKSNLNKPKRIKVMRSIFSDNNGIKPEINYGINYGKKLITETLRN